jgi:hypothetical protein
MAHDVRFSIPERELGKADIQFKVKQNEQLIGTLKISKGSLVWVRKDNKYGHKLTWAKFAELISEHGNHEKGK